MFPQMRMRRLRTSQKMRDLVAETRLDPAELVLPLFFDANITEPKTTDSMPGVVTYPLSGYDIIAKEIEDAGVSSVLVFLGIPLLVLAAVKGCMWFMKRK